MPTIENAKIASTSLGYEDHGILTAFLHLSGEGWGVGFGGYALDTWNDALKRRVGTSYGIEFITSILTTLEVSSWERLPGQFVRVETEGWGGRALRIGHITKNQWFDPKALLEQLKARAGASVG